MVEPIHEEEVEEICEIRGVIEKLAARWAIEKAHPEVVEQLKENVSTSQKKVSKGDARAFIDFDAQFHEIIARLSGSQRLLELAQTLRRHMLRYRLQSIYHKEHALRAIRGHK
jgi:DNA-binding GntR family transcriptional regulator